MVTISQIFVTGLWNSSKMSYLLLVIIISIILFIIRNISQLFRIIYLFGFFFIGSANVFKHMFAYLSHQQSTNTWESTEAALFIMSGKKYDFKK